MRLLRRLNPLRHLRIERENAKLRDALERSEFENGKLLRQIEAWRQQRNLDADGVASFIEIVGRQVQPDTEADTLRRAISAENAGSVLRMRLVIVLDDLRRGRHDLARRELETITGLVEQREAS